MSKKGKKYVEAAKQIEAGKLYSIEEAIELVKKTTTAKFDASVDVVFKLNLDTRHADQQLRGAIVLPNGTGKTKRVCVIAEGPKAEEAKNAGADVVGGQDILDEIAKGWLEFDVMIATPDQMPKLGRLGRILGPKGLMPNPKTGTVTMNVAQAIDEIKKGKVEYRVDKDGNVNVMFGKVSFTEEALNENFKALFDQISKVKPNSVKGAYIKKITVSTTMGPGINVTVE